MREGIDIMALTYGSWPFRPMQARSVEETARWWAHCYVRNQAEIILSGQPHWRVIAGGPGSGKSAAIVDLERREAATSFIVRYPPERWPGSKQAWVREGNHLAQIMAGAAVAVRDYLVFHPDKVADLSEVQRGFIRWLLDKFGGPRAFRRWIDGLEPVFAERFQGIAYEDLFPSAADPIEVQGQIDELANLTRKFGFQRVLVTVDLDQPGAHEHSENLGSLFEWLDLMHHPGLALAAALPSDALEKARVIERARGRVSVVYVKWNAAQVREIASRHIRQALDNSEARLEDFVSDSLLGELENCRR